VEIKTRISKKGYDPRANDLKFFHDGITWTCWFEGCEGYGDTPQKALDDIEESLEADNDQRLLKCDNGYIVEEMER